MPARLAFVAVRSVRATGEGGLRLITLGLEQDLLNGVPWLDRIHSLSMPGLSVIDLTFQPGTDLYAARQQVQERMTQAHALPNVGSPPI